jgi:acyl carrier protein
MEKAAIKTFIENEILQNKNIDNVNESDNLIENGVIDSLSIMKIVTFLEKEFTIKIEDIDLLPENFETIGQICAFVNNKQQKNS